MWIFRFGDVFDPDDPLSIWICTLGIAFNDIIHANVKVNRASTPWERFYEWRVAIAHLSEACLHLERGRALGEVRRFLESDGDVLESYDAVLGAYDELRAVANRFRNEAKFHYPYSSGREAVARVLRELSEEDGAFGSVASTKIKDSRQLYADDVVAHLVWNAAGGSEEAFESAASALGEAVASFGRFSNAALDAYFFRHREALREA